LGCGINPTLGVFQQPLTKSAGKDWLFWWIGIRVRKYNKQEKDLGSNAFCGIFQQPLTKSAGKDWLFW